MLHNGHVTFGSLNTAAKVNDEIVHLWSKLLLSVPESKLIIHIPGSSRSLPAKFARHGVDPHRLKIIPRQPLDQYFQTWSEIDIALDPFPYNGGTTSLDALWMGVPVVTLAGWLPLARAGVTILRNLKLEHLIAANEDRYIQIAASLVGNPQKLSLLRNSLRSLMMRSPLLDASRYIAELEAAYRDALNRRTF